MGAASSVSSSPSGEQQFQGVLPSTHSQRKRVVQGNSFHRNISHQINGLLSNGVETVAHPHRPSRETSMTSGGDAYEDRVCKAENFMDSVYMSSWLTNDEADDLYDCLEKIGEKQRPKDITVANLQKSKYPLWTKYYGLKRRKDGARALDRWGSYHESWMRVEEPPKPLAEIATKLRKQFHLSEDAVNSMVVNYYFDGDNTYIPAHRDTVACLEDDSHVICLSLGASRDFVLCANEDAGKFDKEDMSIAKQWRVQHGDIFAIGQETNRTYCHAITREMGLTSMRISVVFRSIDKSFINFDCEEKIAVYKSGKRKPIRAECITTTTYRDEGIREHLADLINLREETKRQKAAQADANNNAEVAQNVAIMKGEPKDEGGDDVNTSNIRRRYEEELFAQNLKKELHEDGEEVPAPITSTVLASYYMGQGIAVPVIQ